MPDGPRVHFVYNVDPTPLALARDFVHRLRDPATYPCRLCDLTYGRFVKKAEWRRIVAALPGSARFHTRCAFRRRFPRHATEPLPAVFVEGPPGELDLLLSAEELARIPDLEVLAETLRKRLGARGER